MGSKIEEYLMKICISSTRSIVFIKTRQVIFSDQQDSKVKIYGGNARYLSFSAQ